MFIYNEFVVVVGWGYNYRLQNFDCLDRFREFGQFFFVKYFMWLVCVWRDFIYGDEFELRVFNMFVYCVVVSISVINVFFVIIIEICVLK